MNQLYYELASDFEYWEAKHAYQQERLSILNDSARFRSLLRWKKKSKELLALSKWLSETNRDWIHLQLGNKCSWCGRTNQEIKLEIDHVLPKLRHRIMPSSAYIMKEFLEGENLRLLCIQCHSMRHSL